MIAPLPESPLPLSYSDPRGRGIPVLLVHGFSHNRCVWERFSAALPDSMRPIAVDLRGHGKSPWAPDGAYSLPDYASDLRCLLDTLEIRTAYVVGHSLGGNAATLLAASEPARVKGLVLVDTGPALELSGAAHVFDEVGSGLRSYGSIQEFNDQLDMTHPNGDSKILARLAETGVVQRVDGRYEAALDPGVLGTGMDQEARTEMASLERELWAALRDLQCPVLVVRGALSSILSEKVAREMVDEVLERGRLVTLPTAGHAVMIEDAAGLEDAARTFLATL